MVKLRLLSDLHYSQSINGPDYDKTFRNSPLYHYFGKQLLKNQGCINLIAGDLASEPEEHQELLETFFPNQRVLFTGGNHICYYVLLNGVKPILSDIKKGLQTMFPREHLFYTYLENDWTWIPNTDVAVIGSTFYTDYSFCDLTLEEFNDYLLAWDKTLQLWGFDVAPRILPKKLTKSIVRNEAMFAASTRINDFKWARQSKSKLLTPEHYLKLHKESKKKVEECYNHILQIRPNAKIILMTHHCLSPKAIIEKYKKNILNSSYISDLEDWVETMPNIRLVLSGHVHCRKDFVFGKHGQRYIINSCGYFKYNEPFNAPKFNPNLIIDTDDL